MHVMLKKYLVGAVSLILLISTPGCFLSPYVMEVKQGNLVDQEMLDRLKVGMTQEQVKFVLGTPLIVDPLKPNRWNYVFLKGKAGNLKNEQVVIAIFEDDLLIQVDIREGSKQ